MCLCALKKAATAVRVEGGGAQLEAPAARERETVRYGWYLPVPQCVWESVRQLEGWRERKEDKKRQKERDTGGEKVTALLAAI